MQYPLYDEIKKIFALSQGLLTPSEVHGLFTGIICANTKTLPTDALADMGFFSFGEAQLSEAQIKLLALLYEVTKEKITQMEFDFELFLPEDTYSLRDRAEELGHWCEGFMIGFGFAGGKLDADSHKDAIEALEKIGECAQIDYASLEVSEEDEVAFMELIEFIRMAVLVIFCDLHQTDFDGDAQEKNRKYH
jgi:uncharacterized protein